MLWKQLLNTLQKIKKTQIHYNPDYPERNLPTSLFYKLILKTAVNTCLYNHGVA